MNKKIEKIIDQTIPNRLKPYKIPGIGISIINQDKILYKKSYGVANLQSNKKWDLNTIFNIGSTSKSFTCIAILQLMEKDLIQLDDPVFKYMPLEIFQPKQGQSAILIKHLLSHSSGIPDFGINEASLVNSIIPHKTFRSIDSEKEFITLLDGAKDDILLQPMQEFLYNNEMYVILALIVEKISKKSFAQYLKEYIFTPLGMNHSFLKLDLQENKDDLKLKMAKGYYFEGSNPEASQFLEIEHPDKMLPGAEGVFTNILDLTKYMQELMKIANGNQESIIKPNTLKRMFDIQIETDEKYSKYKGGYGFGWIIEPNFYGTKMIHHGGNCLMYSCDFAFIPEKNIGVIIGSNSSSALQFHPQVEEILVALMNQEYRPLPMYSAFNDLEFIFGKYKTYKNYSYATVFVQNQIIYLEIAEAGIIKYRFPLRALNIEEGVFIIPSFPNQKRVQFKKNNKKKLIYFIFDRNIFRKSLEN